MREREREREGEREREERETPPPFSFYFLISFYFFIRFYFFILYVTNEQIQTDKTALTSGPSVTKRVLDDPTRRRGGGWTTLGKP